MLLTRRRRWLSLLLASTVHPSLLGYSVMDWFVGGRLFGVQSIILHRVTAVYLFCAFLRVCGKPAYMEGLFVVLEGIVQLASLVRE